MKKTISFYKQSGTVRGTVSMEVELDTLSPIARKMAERIYTTDMWDDMSFVPLRCKYTESELCKRVVADETGRYTPWERANAKRNLESIASGDPFGIAGNVLKSRYIWDSICPDETPEAFFERHAACLINEKSPYLKDAELDF